MDHDSLTRSARARIAISKELLRQLKNAPRLVAWLGKKRSAPIEGRVFDAEAAAILRFDDLEKGSDMRGLSPERARSRFAEQLAIVEAPPPQGVAFEDRAFRGPGGSLRARIYWPEDLSGSQPAIVYFHGGGFMIGSIETHDAFCQRLALGARCRVISLEYRLAPEDPFPAAIDDGIAGFRWVMENAESLGVDTTRVCVAGDSAGGNLSAVISLRTRSDALRPALQLLLYPATDATCSLPSHKSMGKGFLLTREMIDWYHDHYVGKDPALKCHPDVSPLFAPDFHDAPPAIIYTAGFDPLRDEGSAYGDKLRAAGVSVEVHEIASLPHGFISMTGVVDAARLAVKTIAANVGRRLRSP